MNDFIMHLKTNMNLTLGSIRRFWQRYKRNKAGLIGLGLFTILVFIAIFTPIISPFDPLDNTFETNLPPNNVNYFGTDDLGRDVFSRTVQGAGVSLIVGAFASFTSTLIGIFIGGFAGYIGKGVDLVLMKITELFQVLPQFFVAILIASFFGPGFWGIILVISLLSWPKTARLVRAEFLSLKEQEFVSAAKTVGCNRFTIIFNEILPSAMPEVIVNGSLIMATAILMQASLSFFGLGDPSKISWGKMLSDSQGLLRSAPWASIFPGIAILLTVLSINLIGDALNDAINPKFRER